MSMMSAIAFLFRNITVSLLPMWFLRLANKRTAQETAEPWRTYLEANGKEMLLQEIGMGAQGSCVA
jgi:hypothetical protein